MKKTLLRSGAVILTLTAATAGGAAPSPAQEAPLASTPAAAQAGDTSTTLRDALLQPFPSNSIWNTPIGSTARWVSAGLKPPTGKTLAVEEDIVIADPTAPQQSVYETTAGWSSTQTRCEAATSTVIRAGVPIPAAFRTDPGYEGKTPNHSAAVVMPDGTLFESQPLHVCPDGKVVSQYAPRKWQGTSIYTGATPDNPGFGSHGGSRMSAFGGTIRLGEWSPGRTVIPHVIKIEVWAARYLSPVAGGYRWPAGGADSYAATEYGGPVAALRQGSLLGLRPTFAVDALRTEPARILARTLQGYGAYVVDDTRRDTVAIPVEWSDKGRVRDEFARQWGFPFEGSAARASGAQKDFLLDLEVIYCALAVVDDNSRTTVGGAGTRVAAVPAPLAPRP